MTPALIMADFEGRGGLPRAALMAARQSRAEMVPVFLTYIDRLQTSDCDDLDDLNAFTFIMYLLAEWRETLGYRPLAKLFRREPAFLEALMGDGITESSARIMAGVFDGDLQPLFDIILDNHADGFLRGEMFDTLALVVLHDPVLRPGVTTFLTDFFDLTGEVMGEEIWWAWAECVAALGQSDLQPQVRAVFDRGLITPDHSSFQDFAWRLQATTDAGRPDWFTDQSTNRPISDTAAELEPWYCFSKEYLAHEAARHRVVSTPLSELENPFDAVLTVKTGRNDLCPCGSGKKFKKCCLH